MALRRFTYNYRFFGNSLLPSFIFMTVYCSWTTLRMEAASNSWTSVTMYHSTPRHIFDDMDLQHWSENLEPHMVWHLYLKNVPLSSAGVWEFVYQSVRTANNLSVPHHSPSDSNLPNGTTFCYRCAAVYRQPLLHYCMACKQNSRVIFTLTVSRLVYVVCQNGHSCCSIMTLQCRS